MLRRVEQACRSEGAAVCSHEHPNTHLSDPSHLNYQQNSDYTCILCTALLCAAALQGFTPMLPVLFEFLYLRVGKSAGAERVKAAATETIRSSPESHIYSRVKDFHSSPINRCMSCLPSPSSICCCGTKELPLDNRQLPSGTCQFEIQGLERANVDAAKMAA